jgi:hypothetical protein
LLLIGLGLGVCFVATGFSSAAGGLEGTAPQVAARQALPATLLQHEVTRVIGGDGSDVTSISCPSTPVVATDTVAVCHGVIDGIDSSVKVTFQDSLGHLTLVEN